MPDTNRIRWTALVLLLAVIGVALLLDLAYLIGGSQELFPTAEREDTVRLAAGIIAVTLSVLGWVVARQLRRGP